MPRVPVRENEGRDRHKNAPRWTGGQLRERARPGVGMEGRPEWTPAGLRWWRALLTSPDEVRSRYTDGDWTVAERGPELIKRWEESGIVSALSELSRLEDRLGFTLMARLRARIDLGPAGGPAPRSAPRVNYRERMAARAGGSSATGAPARRPPAPDGARAGVAVAQPPLPRPAERVACAGCGAALPHQSRGQPRKWCSERCRRQHRR